MNMVNYSTTSNFQKDLEPQPLPTPRYWGGPRSLDMLKKAVANRVNSGKNPPDDNQKAPTKNVFLMTFHKIVVFTEYAHPLRYFLRAPILQWVLGQSYVQAALNHVFLFNINV